MLTVKGRDKSNESARSTGTWRAPIEEACVLAGGHDEKSVGEARAFQGRPTQAREGARRYRNDGHDRFNFNRGTFEIRANTHILHF